MGECPDWYGTVAAARYLRVAPWDLEQQPMVWQSRAQAASNAEAHAREMQQR